MLCQSTPDRRPFSGPDQRVLTGRRKDVSGLRVGAGFRSDLKSAEPVAEV
jgi:hypothetical protein